MILARGAMTIFLPRQEVLLEHVAREVQATASNKITAPPVFVSNRSS